MEASVYINKSEGTSSGKTQKAYHFKVKWIIEKRSVLLIGDNRRDGLRETTKVTLGDFELQELFDDCLRAGLVVAPGAKTLAATREALAAAEKSLITAREALDAATKSLRVA